MSTYCSWLHRCRQRSPGDRRRSCQQTGTLTTDGRTSLQPPCLDTLHITTTRHTRSSTRSHSVFLLNLTDFALAAMQDAELTRSAADADKTRDAVRGQSRSPNIVPFWYIRLQKCRDLETGLGVRPCRYLEISPFNQGCWKWYHSIGCVSFLIIQ